MATGKLLRFQFPEHEGMTLKRMNQLRLEEWFCDVTVLVGGLRFPGHRVVLAACSPFLRDRFHMNPSQEVQVFPMAGPEVVLQLLLSCYTGVLEFPFRDIVDYLTAASCLQMEHVVEKCRQSLSPCVASQIGEEGDGEGGDERPCTPQIASSSEREPENPPSWPPGAGDAVKIESDHQQRFQPSEERDGSPPPPPPPPPPMTAREPEQGGSAGTASCYRERAALGYLEPDCRIHSTMEGGEEAAAVGSGGTGEGTVGRYGKAEVMEDEGFVMVHQDLQEEDYESSASEECRSGVFCGSFYRAGEEPPPPALLASRAESSRSEPVRCSECGDLFQHREHLASHMVVHKLYMCLLCGKVFKKNARLAQHINVHTGFKPYCCAICGKTFTQNRSLKDHMNVHSGDSPHCCNYCDMRFTHYNTLRVHLRDQHGKTTGKNSTESKLAEINVVLP